MKLEQCLINIINNNNIDKIAIVDYNNIMEKAMYNPIYYYNFNQLII